jgi:D-glycero-D-manno-heptose 1,7-bisphosphate phosphatase
MNKAIFLDRDGVINSVGNHYYVYRTEDFVFTPHLTEALRTLQDKGFLLIVITNQGGVAKGIYSISDIDNVHQYMQAELAADGVQITATYCCPHHEDFGKCLCRKPLPLLIQKAAARFNVDLKQSYFIGDSQRDMQAAQAAGVRGILVDTDKGIADVVNKISTINTISG